MTGTSQPIASVDDCLARGVGQMVVAADDVGDAHVVIVDDHGVHVGRVAVRAQDDEIVQILVGETHVALHAVAHDRLALLRRLDADRALDAGRRLGRIAVAPAPVIARRSALGARLLAHFLQLGRCPKARRSISRPCRTLRTSSSADLADGAARARTARSARLV
jgi:hypothetical protein